MNADVRVMKMTEIEIMPKRRPSLYRRSFHPKSGWRSSPRPPPPPPPPPRGKGGTVPRPPLEGDVEPELRVTWDMEHHKQLPLTSDARRTLGRCKRMLLGIPEPAKKWCPGSGHRQGMRVARCNRLYGCTVSIP